HARSCRQVTAGRSTQVGTEAEAARCAQSEFVVCRVAESFSGRRRRTVGPHERAGEAVVRSKLTHRRCVVLISGNVVADSDCRETAKIEAIRIALAVDKWPTGLGV